jgi:plastocyanin domain-containing protein
MNTTKWFTLGAAASLFAATPALASDGHQHREHGAGHAAHAPAQPKANYGKSAKGRKVELTVTKDGFIPAQITAKKGEVLNLVITRKVEQTCATEVVQKEQGVHAPLPLDKPVLVTLQAPQDGQLKFSCAHGHIAGTIVTQ